jgi:glycerophosphoryl diester phosphodiesterase
MVEIDVRRTADGVLVLHHDPAIDIRTIVDHPISELPELDRFDDLMAAIGEFPLDIEIKNLPGEPDFDPTFNVALRVAEAARPIDVMTSFHWPTMEAVRGAYPDVATGLLVAGSGELDEAIEMARAQGHTMVAPHWSLLEDAEAAVATASEIQLAAWTVNAGDTGRRLAAAGIAALITDDPATMRRAIEETT